MRTWNCQGLKRHLVEKLIRAMMSGRGVVPHIIMLQEVNITSAELQSMHLPDGWAAAAQMMLVGH